MLVKEIQHNAPSQRQFPSSIAASLGLRHRIFMEEIDSWNFNIPQPFLSLRRDSIIRAYIYHSADRPCLGDSAVKNENRDFFNKSMLYTLKKTENRTTMN